MSTPAMGSRTPIIFAALFANVLLSWTLLPLVIPGFRAYSRSEFFEVLFWQSVSSVGWPFALLGVVFAAPLGAKTTDASALFALMYPAIQVLLVRSVIAKTPRHWELILLHVLVTLSFAVVWYHVLNGFDFMSG